MLGSKWLGSNCPELNQPGSNQSGSGVLKNSTQIQNKRSGRGGDRAAVREQRRFHIVHPTIQQYNNTVINAAPVDPSRCAEAMGDNWGGAAPRTRACDAIRPFHQRCLLCGYSGQLLKKSHWDQVLYV